MLAILMFSRNPKRFIIVYALYFLLTNKSNSHHTGDRVSPRLGRGFWADSLVKYLGANIHIPYMQTILEQAQSGGRFVFAVHPHSIFGISTLIHFALARLITKERFQNLLDFRVLTINMNFFIPVLREYLMARGFVCADPETFSTLIDRGISPVIVPGGSEETLFAYSGSADLVINKRLGFVREALRNNAFLIPVYCFGDNEAVPVIRSERYLRFQRFVQKWLTFATPIIIVFFRRAVPMHMVIGRPLPLPPESAGSFEERVVLYHSQYKDALKSLFDKFLPTYGTDAEKKGPGIRFIK
jgi:2-acylglycerol O-acyltransferase 2